MRSLDAAVVASHQAGKAGARPLFGLLLHRAQRLGMRARGWWLRGLIRALGGKCGRGLLVGRGLYLKSVPHGGFTLGNDVFIGPGCVIDVPAEGTLDVGDSVRFTYGAVIAAAHRVNIGAGTLIGEYVSIRDADHGTAVGSAIESQPLVVSSVQIGRGAWIGRGAALLRGSRIGDGAVIGANAVVRGAIPDGAIAAGVPAKVVRLRGAASCA